MAKTESHLHPYQSTMHLQIISYRQKIYSKNNKYITQSMID